MTKYDLWLAAASREGEPFMLEQRGGKVFLYKLIRRSLIKHDYVPEATYHVWDLRNESQKWLTYRDYLPAYREYVRRANEKTTG